ncbi:bifunctional riboflavin kinase/FAD synthetase [Flavobacterium chuncheonense]|uniref:Riboflavin biosynthesis protein n=1 Tax=Flavobacterium chuncheonense TaxID=2026653 RepID=A0ABW5YM86_9FLAO
MKVFHSINSFKAEKKTIITIGTFDGVHLGHQSILKKVIDQARANNSESTVLTFFPHPRMVLQQDCDIKLLNTIEEKTFLLRQLGVDNLIIHPFDLEFSRLSAEEFVTQVLVEKLNIGKIIIGYDHRFGRNRTATIDDLIAFGEKYNFTVSQISAKEIDEIAISSTKIRKALEEGDVALAKSYLGNPYFITGQVIEGKRIGRTIQFPTANLQPTENYKLIPKIGAYIITADIDNQIVNGMLNIGYNPTLSNDNISIEAHFFNFDGNLYQKTIKVNFLERIRNEQKFDTLEHLKEQLKHDKLYALNYFEKNA